MPRIPARVSSILNDCSRVRAGGGPPNARLGDADKEGEVGRVDEDLGEAGVAAGCATAEGIVGCKAILRGAAERGLGTIPAGAQTGIPQY